MLGRTGCAVVVSALGLGAMAPALSAAPTGPRGAAAAAKPRAYNGRTSQHQLISFTIASGTVRKLRFWIVITCKSHHRYQLQASGFAPIAIHLGRFHATATSHKPAASATVTGRVHPRTVTGTVRLRRYVAPEHATCSGAATYSVGH